MRSTIDFFSSVGALAAVIVCGGSTIMPTTPNTRPAERSETPSIRRIDGTTITVGSDEIRDFIETAEAEKLMPPIEDLKKLAAHSPPPQAWFDEDFTGF